MFDIAWLSIVGADARGIFSGLPDLIERAKLSRVQELLEQGRGGSVARNTWTANCDADRKQVDSLKEELSEWDQHYTPLTDHARVSRAVTAGGEGRPARNAWELTAGSGVWTTDDASGLAAGTRLRSEFFLTV